MPPMARRPFTARSVLSLVVCAAVVLIWVRSYFRSHYFGWHDAPDSGIQLSSTTGKFIFIRLTRLRPDMWGTGWNSYPVGTEERHARPIGQSSLDSSITARPRAPSLERCWSACRFGRYWDWRPSRPPSAVRDGSEG